MPSVGSCCDAPSPDFSSKGSFRLSSAKFSWSLLRLVLVSTLLSLLAAATTGASEAYGSNSARMEESTCASGDAADEVGLRLDSAVGGARGERGVVWSTPRCPVISSRSALLLPASFVAQLTFFRSHFLPMFTLRKHVLGSHDERPSVCTNRPSITNSTVEVGCNYRWTMSMTKRRANMMTSDLVHFQNKKDCNQWQPF